MMSCGNPKESRSFNMDLYAGILAMLGGSPAGSHMSVPPRHPTPRYVITHYRERVHAKRTRKANRGPGFSQNMR